LVSGNAHVVLLLSDVIVALPHNAPYIQGGPNNKLLSRISIESY